MINCRYHRHWRLGSNDIHLIDYVVEPSIDAYCNPIPMPSQELVKFKSATIYKCHFQVVDDLLDIYI